MKKFLKDLERELKMLIMDNNEIEEILEDHKEMIEAAKNDGLDEKQIEEKFGNPKNVAKQIFEDTKKQVKKQRPNSAKVDSCVDDDENDYDLVKSFPVLSGKLSINIGLVSDNLNITTYEGESIQVYQRDIKKIEDYDISFDNNEFILKKGKSSIKLFSFSRDNGDFLVLIPNNVEISKFDYKNVSGDTNINGIISEQYKIKTTSGDVNATNTKSKDMKFSTVSGDMEIAKIEAESLEVSTVSGDFEIEKGNIEGTVYFHTVSGDIELLEVECSEATLKSVSGDLKAKEFYPNQVSLKSVSGDIKIENQDKTREVIIVSQKTLSGEIKIV